MKRMYVKFLIFLMAILFNCNFIRAQGFDVLGVWCSITVNFQSDKVGSDGSLKYTIPAPSGSWSYRGVEGPGRPYLINYLGSTIDLCLDKRRLKLDAEGYSSVTLDLFVDQWLVDYRVGTYQSTPIDWSNPRRNQCHYRIVLNLVW